MSTSTIKKPAKAPAPVVAAAPMTLAQARGVAMTELSQALELIASAGSAATDGHYLDRTLRIAEDIAIAVLGDMDHGIGSRHTWSDRMFDCQSLLKCAAAYNEGPAATLAAQQAAEALDRANDVLDQPFTEVQAAPVQQAAPPAKSYRAISESIVTDACSLLALEAQEAVCIAVLVLAEASAKDDLQSLCGIHTLVTTAEDLMHVAISKGDQDEADAAINLLCQAEALAGIVLEHFDGGEADLLGPARVHIVQARRQLDEWTIAAKKKEAAHA